LHVQLVSARVAQLEIDYRGELAERDVSLITAGAIKGVFQPFTEERINPVNARLVARNRGLNLVERRIPTDGGGYANRLTLPSDGPEAERIDLARQPPL